MRLNEWYKSNEIKSSNWKKILRPVLSTLNSDGNSKARTKKKEDPVD